MTSSSGMQGAGGSGGPEGVRHAHRRVGRRHRRGRQRRCGGAGRPGRGRRDHVARRADGERAIRPDQALGAAPPRRQGRGRLGRQLGPVPHRQCRPRIGATRLSELWPLRIDGDDLRASVARSSRARLSARARRRPSIAARRPATSLAPGLLDRREVDRSCWRRERDGRIPIAERQDSMPFCGILVDRQRVRRPLQVDEQ